jgi:NADH dehydrogenase
VAANIRDDTSVRAAVAGSDAVINLVGILFERGRQTFKAIHADGAGRIARLAAETGVGHLVHVSAIGAEISSESLYGRTKAAGEAATHAAFPTATIVRPSIVFGPEDDFFNRFAGLARLAPVLPLIGGGHTRFQPVYVGDVADAVVAVTAGGADGPDSKVARQTFELGGPRTYSFRDLLELVLAETGRRCLLVPVPFQMAMMNAFFLEALPIPPLTRDQVRLLHSDNVVAPDSRGLGELGISPMALETVLPGYLARYRRGGGRIML